MSSRVFALLYGGVCAGAIIYGVNGWVSWSWAAAVAVVFGFGTLRQAMIAKYGEPEEND